MLLIYCNGKFARHEIKRKHWRKIFLKKKKKRNCAYLQRRNAFHHGFAAFSIFHTFSRLPSIAFRHSDSGREFFGELCYLFGKFYAKARQVKSSQAKRSKYIYISISLPLGDSKGALYEMKNILNWFPPVKTHPIKFVLNFVIQGFSIIVPHVTRFQETHYYNSAAELLKDWSWWEMVSENTIRSGN